MNTRHPTAATESHTDTASHTDTDTDTDTVGLLGKIDGSTVTIGTQPGPSGAGHIVLLRVQSPMLDVLTASFLTVEEAHLLAAALSAAAFAATGQLPPLIDAPVPASHGDDGTHVQHVVRGVEGITAAELCRALAAVPADSRLTDFASDVDTVLVFTQPWAEDSVPPAGEEPVELAANNAA